MLGFMSTHIACMHKGVSVIYWIFKRLHKFHGSTQVIAVWRALCSSFDWGILVTLSQSKSFFILTTLTVNWGLSASCYTSCQLSLSIIDLSVSPRRHWWYGKRRSSNLHADDVTPKCFCSLSEKRIAASGRLSTEWATPGCRMRFICHQGGLRGGACTLGPLHYTAGTATSV